ncbi:MAG: hypothetical protein V2A58_12880, partial [Planctomycetota bacterium]
MRTDCFLLPGESCRIERPLEDLGRKGRSFLVRYLVLDAHSISNHVFLPRPGEENVCDALSEAQVEQAQRTGVRFDRVVCTQAGRAAGFRFSAGKR